jgi:hypothetical protein
MEELIFNGERIFLKKGKKGYRIIKPYKIDGKINWKNLIAGGDWLNLLWIAIGVTLILGCIWEYSNAVKIANECLAKSIF